MYCLSARMYHGYKTAPNLIDKKCEAKQLFYTFASKEELHPIASSSKLHSVGFGLCRFKRQADKQIALQIQR